MFLCIHEPTFTLNFSPKSSITEKFINTFISVSWMMYPWSSVLMWTMSPRIVYLQACFGKTLREHETGWESKLWIFLFKVAGAVLLCKWQIPQGTQNGDILARLEVWGSSCEVSLQEIWTWLDNSEFNIIFVAWEMQVS